MPGRSALSLSRIACSLSVAGLPAWSVTSALTVNWPSARPLAARSTVVLNLPPLTVASKVTDLPFTSVTVRVTCWPSSTLLVVPLSSTACASSTDRLPSPIAARSMPGRSALSLSRIACSLSVAGLPAWSVTSALTVNWPSARPLAARSTVVLNLPPLTVASKVTDLPFTSVTVRVTCWPSSTLLVVPLSSTACASSTDRLPSPIAARSMPGRSALSLSRIACSLSVAGLPAWSVTSALTVNWPSARPLAARSTVVLNLPPLTVASKVTDLPFTSVTVRVTCWPSSTLLVVPLSSTACASSTDRLPSPIAARSMPGRSALSLSRIACSLSVAGLPAWSVTSALTVNWPSARPLAARSTVVLNLPPLTVASKVTDLPFTSVTVRVTCWPSSTLLVVPLSSTACASSTDRLPSPIAARSMPGRSALSLSRIACSLSVAGLPAWSVTSALTVNWPSARPLAARSTVVLNLPPLTVASKVTDLPFTSVTVRVTCWPSSTLLVVPLSSTACASSTDRLPSPIAARSMPGRSALSLSRIACSLSVAGLPAWSVTSALTVNWPSARPLAARSTVVLNLPPLTVASKVTDLPFTSVTVRVTCWPSSTLLVVPLSSTACASSTDRLPSPIAARSMPGRSALSLSRIACSLSVAGLPAWSVTSALTVNWPSARPLAARSTVVLNLPPLTVASKVTDLPFTSVTVRVTCWPSSTLLVVPLSSTACASSTDRLPSPIAARSMPGRSALSLSRIACSLSVAGLPAWSVTSALTVNWPSARPLAARSTVVLNLPPLTVASKVTDLPFTSVTVRVTCWPSSTLLVVPLSSTACASSTDRLPSPIAARSMPGRSALSLSRIACSLSVAGLPAWSVTSALTVNWPSARPLAARSTVVLNLPPLTVASKVTDLPFTSVTVRVTCWPSSTLLVVPLSSTACASSTDRLPSPIAARSMPGRSALSLSRIACSLSVAGLPAWSVTSALTVNWPSARPLAARSTVVLNLPPLTVASKVTDLPFTSVTVRVTCWPSSTLLVVPLSSTACASSTDRLPSPIAARSMPGRSALSLSRIACSLSVAGLPAWSVTSALTVNWPSARPLAARSTVVLNLPPLTVASKVTDLPFTSVTVRVTCWPSSTLLVVPLSSTACASSTDRLPSPIAARSMPGRSALSLSRIACSLSVAGLPAWSVTSALTVNLPSARPLAARSTVVLNLPPLTVASKVTDLPFTSVTVRVTCWPSSTLLVVPLSSTACASSTDRLPSPIAARSMPGRSALSLSRIACSLSVAGLPAWSVTSALTVNWPSARPLAARSTVVLNLPPLTVASKVTDLPFTSVTVRVTCWPSSTLLVVPLSSTACASSTDRLPSPIAARSMPGRSALSLSRIACSLSVAGLPAWSVTSALTVNWPSARPLAARSTVVLNLPPLTVASKVTDLPFTSVTVRVTCWPSSTLLVVPLSSTACASSTDRLPSPIAARSMPGRSALSLSRIACSLSVAGLPAWSVTSALTVNWPSARPLAARSTVVLNLPPLTVASKVTDLPFTSVTVRVTCWPSSTLLVVPLSSTACASSTDRLPSPIAARSMPGRSALSLSRIACSLSVAGLPAWSVTSALTVNWPSARPLAARSTVVLNLPPLTVASKVTDLPFTSVTVRVTCWPSSTLLVVPLSSTACASSTDRLPSPIAARSMPGRSALSLSRIACSLSVAGLPAWSVTSALTVNWPSARPLAARSTVVLNLPPLTVASKVTDLPFTSVTVRVTCWPSSTLLVVPLSSTACASSTDRLPSPIAARSMPGRSALSLSRIACSLSVAGLPAWSVTSALTVNWPSARPLAARSTVVLNLPPLTVASKVTDLPFTSVTVRVTCWPSSTLLVVPLSSTACASSTDRLPSPIAARSMPGRSALSLSRIACSLSVAGLPAWSVTSALTVNWPSARPLAARSTVVLNLPPLTVASKVTDLPFTSVTVRVTCWPSSTLLVVPLSSTACASSTDRLPSPIAARSMPGRSALSLSRIACSLSVAGLPAWSVTSALTVNLPSARPLAARSTVVLNLPPLTVASKVTDLPFTSVTVRVTCWPSSTLLVVPLSSTACASSTDRLPSPIAARSMPGRSALSLSRIACSLSVAGLPAWSVTSALTVNWPSARPLAARSTVVLNLPPLTVASKVTDLPFTSVTVRVTCWPSSTLLVVPLSSTACASSTDRLPSPIAARSMPGRSALSLSRIACSLSVAGLPAWSVTSALTVNWPSARPLAARSTVVLNLPPLTVASKVTDLPFTSVTVRVTCWPSSTLLVVPLSSTACASSTDRLPSPIAARSMPGRSALSLSRIACSLSVAGLPAWSVTSALTVNWPSARPLAARSTVVLNLPPLTVASKVTDLPFTSVTVRVTCWPSSTLLVVPLSSTACASSTDRLPSPIAARSMPGRSALSLSRIACSLSVAGLPAWSVTSALTVNWPSARPLAARSTVVLNLPPLTVASKVTDLPFTSVTVRVTCWPSSTLLVVPLSSTACASSTDRLPSPIAARSMPGRSALSLSRIACSLSVAGLPAWSVTSALTVNWPSARPLAARSTVVLNLPPLTVASKVTDLPFTSVTVRVTCWPSSTLLVVPLSSTACASSTDRLPSPIAARSMPGRSALSLSRIACSLSVAGLPAWSVTSALTVNWPSARPLAARSTVVLNLPPLTVASKVTDLPFTSVTVRVTCWPSSTLLVVPLSSTACASSTDRLPSPIAARSMPGRSALSLSRIACSLSVAGLPAWSVTSALTVNLPSARPLAARSTVVLNLPPLTVASKVTDLPFTSVTVRVTCWPSSTLLVVPLSSTACASSTDRLPSPIAARSMPGRSALSLSRIACSLSVAGLPAWSVTSALTVNWPSARPLAARSTVVLNLPPLTVASKVTDLPFTSVTVRVTCWPSSTLLVVPLSSTACASSTDRLPSPIAARSMPGRSALSLSRIACSLSVAGLPAWSVTSALTVNWPSARPLAARSTVVLNLPPLTVASKVTDLPFTSVTVRVTCWPSSTLLVVPLSSTACASSTDRLPSPIAARSMPGRSALSLSRIACSLSVAGLPAWSVTSALTVNWPSARPLAARSTVVLNLPPLTVASKVTDLPFTSVTVRVTCWPSSTLLVVPLSSTACASSTDRLPSPIAARSMPGRSALSLSRIACSLSVAGLPAWSVTSALTVNWPSARPLAARSTVVLNLPPLTVASKVTDLPFTSVTVRVTCWPSSTLLVVPLSSTACASSTDRLPSPIAARSMPGRSALSLSRIACSLSVAGLPAWSVTSALTVNWPSARPLAARSTVVLNLPPLTVASKVTDLPFTSVTVRVTCWPSSTLLVVPLSSTACASSTDRLPSPIAARSMPGRSALSLSRIACSLSVAGLPAWSVTSALTVNLPSARPLAARSTVVLNLPPLTVASKVTDLPFTSVTVRVTCWPSSTLLVVPLSSTACASSTDRLPSPIAARSMPGRSALSLSRIACSLSVAGLPAWSVTSALTVNWPSARPLAARSTVVLNLPPLTVASKVTDLPFTSVTVRVTCWPSSTLLVVPLSSTACASSTDRLPSPIAARSMPGRSALSLSRIACSLSVAGLPAWSVTSALTVNWPSARPLAARSTVVLNLPPLTVASKVTDLPFTSVTVRVTCWPSSTLLVVPLSSTACASSTDRLPSPIAARSMPGRSALSLSRIACSLSVAGLPAWSVTSALTVNWPSARPLAARSTVVLNLPPLTVASKVTDLPFTSVTVRVTCWPSSTLLVVPLSSTACASSTDRLPSPIAARSMPGRSVSTP